MSTKEKILSMVETFDENITFDEAIEKLYFLMKVERGLEQADRGDVMDHDDFFNELLSEDETNSSGVGQASSRRSSRNKKVHRSKRSSNRSKVRKSAAKSRG